MEVSLLKLKLSEKDRKIEFLERKMEQKSILGLRRLSNIATQTDKLRQRKVSWELTSYSLLRSINPVN